MGSISTGTVIVQVSGTPDIVPGTPFICISLQYIHWYTGYINNKKRKFYLKN